MAKVNGIGVIAIAGGGLLLYSAIYGKGFSSEIRTLLGGKPLSSAQSANPIDVFSAPGSTGTLGNEFSSNVQVSASPSETQWIKSVLLGLGAPATQANINSLAAWIAHEGPYGTQGQNNPLNTSITNVPGYVGKWSLAPIVSMFATATDGVNATIKTLAGYPEIVAALRSGNGLCGNPNVAGELSTWSGGGYSQVC